MTSALWIALALGGWIALWFANTRLVAARPEGGTGARAIDLLVPVLFGLALLLLWEGLVRGFGVSPVILPPPSTIAERFAASTDVLWADFVQTWWRGVVRGYVIGCAVGFALAILCDRSAFLRAGLMPIGNLMAALPIIGVAPIMVMWFGFDWQSKAAVVVLMTVFPMLVNTVAGLAATDTMGRDLMRSYASGYWTTLWKLRLPAAMPFVFNALKINSTLALIGAIVAEFFGTPLTGMGLRIKQQMGSLDLDMVWATIAVAALVGSLTYGAIALIERAVTHWHPSMRGR